MMQNEHVFVAHVGVSQLPDSPKSPPAVNSVQASKSRIDRDSFCTHRFRKCLPAQSGCLWEVILQSDFEECRAVRLGE